MQTYQPAPSASNQSEMNSIYEPESQHSAPFPNGNPDHSITHNQHQISQLKDESCNNPSQTIDCQSSMPHNQNHFVRAVTTLSTIQNADVSMRNTNNLKETPSLVDT